MKNTKQITEGALLTGIYLVMLLIIIFLPIPILSTFVMLALPIPFVIYSYHFGYKAGFFMFFGALVLASVIATVFSLPVTLLTGVGGVALGGAMHNNRNAYETWVTGSLGFIGGLVAVYVLTQTLFGVNWMEEIQVAVDESITITEDMLGSAGEEETGVSVDALRQQLENLPDYLPSILAATGIFMALISQWLSYKLINRLERTSLSFPPVREMRLPTSILWYYFIAMLFNFIFMEQGGIWYIATVNVFTLTGMLLILQGFSFVFFYSQQKNWPKAAPIIVVLLSVLMPQIFLYLVRILGIIDIGFPWRDRIEGKK
ncbi:YybS family protein [Salimicrobium sp. PL1-032A]|uniref:YybS family protein n=1 Tax=Salimicrobium sp. PL1-032A TaxID=3095364 RepID=UPI003261A4DE